VIERVYISWAFYYELTISNSWKSNKIKIWIETATEYKCGIVTNCFLYVSNCFCFKLYEIPVHFCASLENVTTRKIKYLNVKKENKFLVAIDIWGKKIHFI